MATSLWSTLGNGQILAFNPAQDKLIFNDASISAARLGIDADNSPASFNFTYNGKTVTLNADVFALTTTNVSFANGSMLLIGDNTTAVPDALTGGADDGPNTLLGGSGDDVLAGAGGADSVNGGGGNDFFRINGGLSSSYGNDTINGGAGSDTIRYGFPSFGVIVNLGTGIATGGDGNPGSTLTLIGIENVIGREFNDVLTGDGNANLLDGGAGGNDTLIGGSGIDFLRGGPGADVLNGGAGSDYADYLTATTAVMVNLSTPASNTGEAAGDSYNSIERIRGGDFNDTITGSTGNNRLEGQNGNDSLVGGAGNDVLIGGIGNDTLNGGVGADNLQAAGGNDTLIWDPADSNVDGGGGGDILKLAGSGITLDFTSISNTLIKGIEKINLTGSGNNTLVLNMDDLMALSSTTDQLIVLGNAGDSVSSATQGWALFGQQTIGGQLYDEYHHLTTHVLLVDQDITSTIS